MLANRNLDGGVDLRDIPQEPRKAIAPVPVVAPSPLVYFVTTRKSAKSIFGPADVTACTSWARQEAVVRAASLEVREVGTGAVFFGFDARGVFC